MKFINVSKAYAQNVIFDRFSLEIEAGTILSVVGPSGQGKTTLLHLASGLIEADSGEVVKEESEEGAVSYLFQEPRLIPSSTVFSNVELALRSTERCAKIAARLPPTTSVWSVSGRTAPSIPPSSPAACANGGHRPLVCPPEPPDVARRAVPEPGHQAAVQLDESVPDTLEREPEDHHLRHPRPEGGDCPRRAVCCLGDASAPLLLQKIDTPRDARGIDDEALLALEGQLIKALLSPRG